MDGHNHYLRIDSESRVIKGFSDAFEQPEESDILYAEGAGRHFEIDGETNPSLITEMQIPKFKWDGESLVPRTHEEIQIDIDNLPKPPISDNQRIQELEDAILELSELMV